MINLVLLEQRVLLREFGLLLGEVVEGTVVALRVSVFGAEHIAALASQFDQTYFLLAIPALVGIRLNSVSKSWLNQISLTCTEAFAASSFFSSFT